MQAVSLFLHQIVFLLAPVRISNLEHQFRPIIIQTNPMGCIFKHPLALQGCVCQSILRLTFGNRDLLQNYPDNSPKVLRFHLPDSTLVIQEPTSFLIEKGFRHSA